MCHYCRLLFFGVFAALSSVVVANPISSTNAPHASNESALITIAPHTRSAAVNAQHAAECASIGGVDITDRQSFQVGHDVTDTVLCEIKDKTKYSAYQKLKHPQANLKQTCQTFMYDEKKPEDGTYSLCVQSRGHSYYGYPINYSSVYTLTTGKGARGAFLRHAIYIESTASNYCYAADDHSLNVAAHSSSTYEFITRCDMSYHGPDTVYYQRNHNVSWVYTRYTPSDEIKDQAPFNVEYPYDWGTLNVSKSQNLGQPLNNAMCNVPSPDIGNPINTITGNKFQQEADYAGRGVYPLEFVRYYNSQNDNGKWTHSYSAHIVVTNYDNHAPKIALIHDDGREEVFFESKGVILPMVVGYGSLQRTDYGYRYDTQYNERFEFDKSGNLLKTVKNGQWHTIERISRLEIKVSDNFGQSLTILDNGNFEPERVTTSGGKTITYQYDNKNRLIEMSKNGKTRKYHYEDSRFPYALTGITNERGIRYVTWSYDDKVRVISSDNVDGINSFNSVYYNGIYYTNYRDINNNLRQKNFALLNGRPINGKNFVDDIQMNNRSLTFYKYDKYGNITYNSLLSSWYDYNEKGQQISQTIAKGAPEQAVITTTWDDKVNKPKTVTYPDKIVTNIYDGNGNITDIIIKPTN